jgi:hypothetical protein
MVKMIQYRHFVALEKLYRSIIVVKFPRSSLRRNLDTFSFNLQFLFHSASYKYLILVILNKIL